MTLRITNTSAVNFREVVQVYYDPMREGQPVRLAGWAEVSVEAGKTSLAPSTPAWPSCARC